MAEPSRRTRARPAGPRGELSARPRLGSTGRRVLACSAGQAERGSVCSVPWPGPRARMRRVSARPERNRPWPAGPAERHLGPAIRGQEYPWACRTAQKRRGPEVPGQEYPWACGPAQKHRGSSRQGQELPWAGARVERASGSRVVERPAVRRRVAAPAWAAALARQLPWATARLPPLPCGRAPARRRSMSWGRGPDQLPGPERGPERGPGLERERGPERERGLGLGLGHSRASPARGQAAIRWRAAPYLKDC